MYNNTTKKKYCNTTPASAGIPGATECGPVDRTTMKRRNFLIGAGSAAIGGSALLGSGAFSRVESHRSMTVQIANDPNAYLGMDDCMDSEGTETPNSSYAQLDEFGHLEVDMTDTNPTEGDGQGVNSDSITWADNVFQVCNQGKEPVCLWLDPDSKDGADPDRVTLYVDADSRSGSTTPERLSDDDPRTRELVTDDDGLQTFLGVDDSIPVEVGECVCVGVQVYTKEDDSFEITEPAEGDQLLDEVGLVADVNEYDDVNGTSLGALRGEDPLAVQNVSTQSLGITDLSASGTGPTDLANELLPAGSGISVSNVNFVGEDVQGGTFTGGTGIVGFDEGILLSSGDVNDVVGPNDSPSTTTNHGNPGDSDLDALAGDDTLDAATLEFDFTVPQGTTTVGFNYVFGSEEYNEFVGSEFNDVFGFFLNGTNVAVVDDPDGPGTIPAAINNINEGNGGSPTTEPTNPDLYINNDPVNPNFDGETVDPPDLLDTEMDGLTVVLDIEDTVNDGPNETNTLKLGVADTSDRILDSWVLLEAGSLETDPDPDPEPSSPCGGS